MSLKQYKPVFSKQKFSLSARKITKNKCKREVISLNMNGFLLE